MQLSMEVVVKDLEENKRTSSIGLLRFSSSYLKAALKVLPVPETISQKFRFKYSDSEPAYFLAARSIELSLKAFLRGHGIGVRKLKYKPFGHDLEQLLQEARKRKLGREVKLVPAEIAAIRVVSGIYKVKDLEYIVTGTKSVPFYWDLVSAGRSLVNGLGDYCYRATFSSEIPNHLRKQLKVI